VPFHQSTKRFSRIWKFVDQFISGDAALRSSFDVALDDVADGLNAAVFHMESEIAETKSDVGAALEDVSNLKGQIGVWRGEWASGQSLQRGDTVRSGGNVYIVLVDHDASALNDDINAARIELYVPQGAPGPGSGDMQAENNLSEITDAAIARANIGAAALTQLTGVGQLKPVYAEDLNSGAMVSGIYHTTSETVNTPEPPGEYVVLHLRGDNSSRRLQIAGRGDVGFGKRVWYRVSNPSFGGIGWGSWIEFTRHELTEAETVDPASTVFGLVSGQRLNQQTKSTLNASGEAPMFACRASMDSSGAILAHGNLSTGVKNGTGEFSFTFDVDMPDENYAVVGNSMRPDGSAAVMVLSKTVSGFTAQVRGGTNALIDPGAQVFVAVFR
jgi:hypothetical protein